MYPSVRICGAFRLHFLAIIHNKQKYTVRKKEAQKNETKVLLSFKNHVTDTVSLFLLAIVLWYAGVEPGKNKFIYARIVSRAVASATTAAKARRRAGTVTTIAETTAGRICFNSISFHKIYITLE